MSKLTKDINSIFDCRQTPSKTNKKKSIPEHIRTKLLKTKDKAKLLATAKDKKREITYKGAPIRWTVLNRNHGSQKN